MIDWSRNYFPSMHMWRENCMTIFKIFKRDFPKVLKNRHSCLLLSGTHINHDEQLVLTIYTQYILIHTDHQTTAGIQLVIIHVVVTRLAAVVVLCQYVVHCRPATTPIQSTASDVLRQYAVQCCLVAPPIHSTAKKVSK